MTTAPPPETYFAPAERAGAAEIAATHRDLMADEAVQILLQSLPGVAFIVNEQRQIVAYGCQLERSLKNGEPMAGLRPGELLGCVSAADAPNGCGTGQACRHCGAVRAVLACLASQRVVVNECRLRTDHEADGGALDLRVHCTPLTIGGRRLVVVAVTDISGEKRREALERIFFHDLLNTAGGLQGLAHLMTETPLDPELDRDCRRDIRRLADSLVDEVQGQRQLLAAERGSLQVRPTRFAAATLLLELLSIYRHHPVAAGKSLSAGQIDAVELRADLTLLRRILGNLVKNALEASAPGEVVRVSALADGEAVVFEVHNPGVMPEAVQAQLFQRSFSTKGEPGRGLGTHGAKLFCERYLGGTISFTSAAATGTTFRVRLPREREDLSRLEPDPT